MNLIQLHQAEFDQDFAKHLADKIADVLVSQDKAYIAVSGGKSPAKWLEMLSKYNIAWDRVVVSLVDDRFTANLGDRNDQLIHQYLLINNAVNCKFIPLISDEKSIQNCVDNANLSNTDFDIVVLGMGNDAHTASIFPCCSQLSDALSSTNDYIITEPTTAPYQRIGFTLTKILNSKLIMLPLNDESKLNTFKSAVKSLDANKPISYVALKHIKLEVYSI